LLAQRMDEVVDGDYQRYAARGGAYLREHFFGADDRLLAMVEHLSDAELDDLHWGGHDVKKVHAAYRAAEAEEERPTVILAKTVKGYGLGDAGEARNVTHQTKILKEEGLRYFRDRFHIPLSDEDVGQAPFLRPAADGAEVRYAQERREQLGGPVPRRRVQAPALEMPGEKSFARLLEGTRGRVATTTVLTVRMLNDLLKDENIGDLIVPIIPDEARTFGVEALFPRVGIYSPYGQNYEPVDKESLLTYKESTRGQLLEEGITEAGSMASTIAAGTAYATHGVNTIPFFFFYSMFGFQRIGDFIWAAGDMRTRGFLIGATSGRTTLNGEGLQHQDGHSQLVAMTHPTVRAFDPAYGYELATIVEDGLQKMYGEGQSLLYYITVTNEQYEHPPMPDGVREGILSGMYQLAPSSKSGEVRRARLLASGVMVREALRAQAILEDDYGVTADVWSVTSWKTLFEEAAEVERTNLRRPGDDERVPYVRACLGENPGVVVAVSDYIKALPSTLGRWLGPAFVTLGTDGFGRSESREALRDFFEVDYRHITVAALAALARDDRYPAGSVQKAIEDFGLDVSKPNPLHL
ncbi:MAG: transketolase-like TK C-terminal-containing protein, partial [Bradymonadaceae bacterium]